MTYVRYLCSVDKKLFAYIPQDKCYIQTAFSGVGQVHNAATDKFLGVYTGIFESDGGVFGSDCKHWYQEAKNKRYIGE